MSKKKPALKDFQLSVKIECHYEVNVKASNFQEAAELAKKLNSFDIVTKMTPFDSSPPELWAIIDPSI